MTNKPHTEERPAERQEQHNSIKGGIVHGAVSWLIRHLLDALQHLWDSGI